MCCQCWNILVLKPARLDGLLQAVTLPIGYGVTANITASHLIAVARGSIPRIRGLFFLWPRISRVFRPRWYTRRHPSDRTASRMRIEDRKSKSRCLCAFNISPGRLDHRRSSPQAFKYGVTHRRDASALSHVQGRIYTTLLVCSMGQGELTSCQPMVRLWRLVFVRFHIKIISKPHAL